MNYLTKFIEYGSDEYNQAAQLRYRLFYQEHNIPFDSIFEPQEKQDLHVAIIADPGNSVIAYGRLGQNSLQEFQIYQMVVMPEFQGGLLKNSTKRIWTRSQYKKWLFRRLAYKSSPNFSSQMHGF